MKKRVQIYHTIAILRNYMHSHHHRFTVLASIGYGAKTDNLRTQLYTCLQYDKNVY